MDTNKAEKDKFAQLRMKKKREQWCTQENLKHTKKTPKELSHRQFWEQGSTGCILVRNRKQPRRK